MTATYAPNDWVLFKGATKYSNINSLAIIEDVIMVAPWNKQYIYRIRFSNGKYTYPTDSHLIKASPTEEEILEFMLERMKS